jgi:hypothetical protein
MNPSKKTKYFKSVCRTNLILLHKWMISLGLWGFLTFLEKMRADRINKEA